ncbi:MAG TPA: hypothetical protein VE868_02530 [Balneolaceae bacterium]|nr:hypothetical protein [Balneolaceae bacterium]
MKQTSENSTNASLNRLKKIINQLIDEYEENCSLLNDQIQAVINHDITSLNELIERQVRVYETLKSSEEIFKKHLKEVRQRHDLSSQSLQEMLNDLEEPTQTLNAMRDRLHAQVRKTEGLRNQLMDLLNFAKRQNAEIFKAICEAGSDKMGGYNADGEKQRQSNSYAINQKA